MYKVIDRLIRLPRIGRYEDRYILVTGCDTGFGNLLAKRLDELGCHVFAGCFTEKGEVDLKKTSSERLHAFPLDVTKPESVQNAFDFVKSKLPPEKGNKLTMANVCRLRRLLCGVKENTGSLFKRE